MGEIGMAGVIGLGIAILGLAGTTPWMILICNVILMFCMQMEGRFCLVNHRPVLCIQLVEHLAVIMITRKRIASQVRADLCFMKTTHWVKRS